MKTSKANVRAQKKYDDRVAVRKNCKFIIGHDDDIIEHLKSIDNFNAYIKRLVREDIKKV